MGLVGGLRLASSAAKVSPKAIKEYQKYQQDTIKPLKQVVFENQQTYDKYLRLVKEECYKRIDILSQQNPF